MIKLTLKLYIFYIIIVLIHSRSLKKQKILQKVGTAAELGDDFDALKAIRIDHWTDNEQDNWAQTLRTAYHGQNGHVVPVVAHDHNHVMGNWIVSLKTTFGAAQPIADDQGVAIVYGLGPAGAMSALHIRKQYPNKRIIVRETRAFFTRWHTFVTQGNAGTRQDIERHFIRSDVYPAPRGLNLFVNTLPHEVSRFDPVGHYITCRDFQYILTLIIAMVGNIEIEIISTIDVPDQPRVYSEEVVDNPPGLFNNHGDLNALITGIVADDPDVGGNIVNRIVNDFPALENADTVGFEGIYNHQRRESQRQIATRLSLRVDNDNEITVIDARGSIGKKFIGADIHEQHVGWVRIGQCAGDIDGQVVQYDVPAQLGVLGIPTILVVFDGGKNCAQLATVIEEGDFDSVNEVYAKTNAQAGICQIEIKLNLKAGYVLLTKVGGIFMYGREKDAATHRVNGDGALKDDIQIAFRVLRRLIRTGFPVAGDDGLEDGVGIDNAFLNSLLEFRIYGSKCAKLVTQANQDVQKYRTSTPDAHMTTYFIGDSARASNPSTAVGANSATWLSQITSLPWEEQNARDVIVADEGVTTAFERAWCSWAAVARFEWEDQGHGDDRVRGFSYIYRHP